MLSDWVYYFRTPEPEGQDVGQWRKRGGEKTPQQHPEMVLKAGLHHEQEGAKELEL